MVIFVLEKFLKTNEKVRRLFGRKELVIMVKQMNGDKLTQSERNRLSRDIKPKLECIKEISQFKEEFALEKNQNNNRIIEKAVATILDDPINMRICAILLFGSFADGSFTRRSDIDVCVLFNRPLSLKVATEFRIRVSGQLPDKVDIQVFNILPQKVKKAIAGNHRILYKGGDYNNLDFSIQYLKDEDYFLRMRRIYGAVA